MRRFRFFLLLGSERWLSISSLLALTPSLSPSEAGRGRQRLAFELAASQREGVVASFSSLLPLERPLPPSLFHPFYHLQFPPPLASTLVKDVSPPSFFFAAPGQVTLGVSPLFLLWGVAHRPPFFPPRSEFFPSLPFFELVAKARVSLFFQRREESTSLPFFSPSVAPGFFSPFPHQSHRVLFR